MSSLADDPAMSLPDGWEVKRLGEVCDFIRGPFGGSLKKSIFVDDGIAVYEQQHAIYNQFDQVRYFITNEKFKKMQRFELLPDDLIMSCSGTMGKTAIVPSNIKKGIINQALLKLATSKELKVEYLKIWMESKLFQDDIAIYSQGAAIKNVAPVKILKQIKIPLPPLPEQKRIVALLDQAFTAINKVKANTEQNLKNARELFQSVLQTEFDSGKSKIKTGEWEEKKLGDVCEYDKKKNTQTDLPYVGLEHIESNTGKFIGSKASFQVKSATFYFSNQHVLYGRLRPYLNKVLVPDFSGHCSTEIFPIKASELIVRKFLFYWFVTNNTVEKINATWTGTRMPRANMKEVINFSISVPSIEKQQAIVQKLDALSTETKKLETLYQQKITDLDELKNSLLQKAFSGKL